MSFKHCMYHHTSFFMIHYVLRYLLADEEESPFVDPGWYKTFARESFSNNIDYHKFEDTYKSRGFHRVKGEQPPDWNAFLSFSSSPDLSDLRDVLVLSKDEISKYGHQRDDLILQCTYNEQICNMR